MVILSSPCVVFCVQFGHDWFNYIPDNSFTKHERSICGHLPLLAWHWKVDVLGPHNSMFDIKNNQQRKQKIPARDSAVPSARTYITKNPHWSSRRRRRPLLRKVSGSTLRALLGFKHSCTWPPRLAQEKALWVTCSCMRGVSRWFTPLACPGSPELSKSHMDMASKLFTFTQKKQRTSW